MSAALAFGIFLCLYIHHIPATVCFILLTLFHMEICVVALYQACCGFARMV